MIAKYIMAIEKIFGGLSLTLYVRDYYKIGRSTTLKESGNDERNEARGTASSGLKIC